LDMIKLMPWGPSMCSQIAKLHLWDQGFVFIFDGSTELR
jgi:hypothetical protein